MRWQTEHRRDSPYPLRHHGTNVHIVEQRGDEATFASYIHVTQVVNEIAGEHSRRRSCAARCAQEAGRLRISELHVVLDTMTSDVFSAVKA